MRRDFDTADKVLPKFPKKQRTRVAHFLEKQGFRKQALAVGSDPEHRFDLAIQLGDLDTACALVQESGSEQKWKQLAELTTSQAKFELAQQCLHEAQDHGGLLLLATAAKLTRLLTSKHSFSCEVPVLFNANVVLIHCSTT